MTTTYQTPSSVSDLQMNDQISYIKNAEIVHGTVKKVELVSPATAYVLVELNHPVTIKFLGFTQLQTVRFVTLTDDDMLKITRPVSIRELYKMTWRNARCVGSLDHRATTDNLKLLGWGCGIVDELVETVIQQKNDRAYGEFGWVNYFNYRKFTQIIERINAEKAAQNNQ